MAEDFDVEAMLEAPFMEKKEKSNGEKVRDRSPKRDSKERNRRSRSREKERGDRRRRSRSRSKDKERRRRSRSRDKRERRSSSKTRDRHRRRHSRSPEEFKSRRDRRRDRRRSRSRSPRRDLAPEERDMRTVFCMQLAARITSRELEEFFSAVGKVREVRLIMDNKTRRHKGIAYIEYHEINSVSLALALNGHKLCGVPIVIQPTQAEKNRAAASAAAAQRGIAGPLRLYVGSLHFNITEDMLRGIFEPFGRIDKIELQRDDSGRSKGFGFITFFESEDAKKALEQLNGFELAGRAMKVNYVTERTDSLAFQNQSGLDSDDLDRSGIELGTTGRLQLMAKLAEGTGIKLPQAAINALSMGQAVAAMPPNVAQTASAAAAQLAGNGASVATPCFMLTNMFDPDTESDSNWPTEIRNDVLEECEKHGGALHVFVDPKSQGNVYVKCPTATIASGCVKSLHGRFFAGRTVTAAYVPVVHYHSLFPDSVNVSSPI